MAKFNGTADGDTYYGGDRGDQINGFGGSDTLAGWTGADLINGGDGNDYLFGHIDFLDDGQVDTLNGGAGDDAIVAGVGDQVDGGAGFDSAAFVFEGETAAVNVDWSGLVAGQAYVFHNGARMIRVESLTVDFGQGGDRVKTGGMSTWLNMGEGDDTVVGGKLDDTMNGESGADSLSGGAGADQIDTGGFDFTGDTASGGKGDDFIYAQGRDVIDGGEGYDGFSLTLIFSDAVKLDFTDFNFTGAFSLADGTQVSGMEYGTLRLSDQADKVTIDDADIGVTGRFGNDTIIGGAGSDIIGGGGDDDRLLGGGGVDTLSYSDIVGGGVTVSLLVTTAQDTGAAGTDTVSGFENINGTETGGDRLSGTNANNRLFGLGGDDTLAGVGGDDTLVGDTQIDPAFFTESHDDVINGGKGNDTIWGGEGADQLKGGAGADVFLYFAYTDTYETAPDTIVGLRGEDVIDLGHYDADFYTAGDQAFILVDGPTTAAGDMWWTYDAGAQMSRLWLNDTGGDPTVYIEATGDQRAFDHFVF